MTKCKERIKRFLLEKMPYGLYKNIEIWFRNAIKKDEKYEYRFAYMISKKRSKEKYCIFRFQLPDYMTFAAGIQYIFAYEYARSKGFIPVIDMECEYCFSQYELGKDNAWEYCFEQPVSVEEALKKDYVLVETFGMPGTWLDQMCLDINGRKGDHWIHATQENWREYYAKVNQYVRKCWTFKSELINDYQQKYGCKIKEGDRVLGVSLRELFSADAFDKWNPESAKVYADHPVAPGLLETLEIVKKYMTRWNCDKIFLSTVFQESVDLFVHEFGENVVYVERLRDSSVASRTSGTDEYEMSDKEYYEHISGIPNFLGDRLVPYAEEVIGLSECDYLIAAKSGGSIAALALNGGKFKDIYILEDMNKTSRY